MNIIDGRHLEMINDGMGFIPRESAIVDHPAVAALHREMDAEVVTAVSVQNARPGMYVATDDMDTFRKVVEYPVITGQGVFVNLSGGQIGPLPLDTAITVDISH
jgi:hypothetical protein